MNIIWTDLWSLTVNVQRSWLSYKNESLVEWRVFQLTHSKLWLEMPSIDNRREKIEIGQAINAERKMKIHMIIFPIDQRST